jgi:hypothetical protein
MSLPRMNPTTLALGDTLVTALRYAARHGDTTPAIHAADTLITTGAFPGTRGELLATMLFRLEFALALTPNQPSPYYPLSRQLVREGTCTTADMKAAVCGTLLTCGQQQGWLEPHWYDMLHTATRNHADWQRAMSLIKRGQPPGSAPK